jgi:hypothetical protein
VRGLAGGIQTHDGGGCIGPVRGSIGPFMWREIATCFRFERRWLAAAIALGLSAGAVVGPVVAAIVDIVEDGLLP